MSNRILITDDAHFMRATLKNILVNNGFEVVGEAGGGLESVELYKQLQPDLVTMDIAMADLNGIAAMKQIILFDPTVKVIICSAMAQRDLVVEAIHAGAKDFIVKPFQPASVLEAILKQLAA